MIRRPQFSKIFWDNVVLSLKAILLVIVLIPFGWILIPLVSLNDYKHKLARYYEQTEKGEPKNE